MNICVVCDNHRIADYWWRYTLDTIHENYIAEYYNLSYNKHSLKIYFSQFVLYFISEHEYYKWSKGRHDVKFMTPSKYEHLMDRYLLELQRRDNEKL